MAQDEFANMNHCIIRQADEGDFETIVALIRGSVHFQQTLPKVSTTVEKLQPS